jgi:predicted lipase
LFDVEGFVGYLPSDNSIYIAYRGSESINNWISNLDAFKDVYDEWPECNCEVHGGFQNAIQSVQDEVSTEVRRLKGLYPNYDVKVTGHSLGAALALLNGMALLKEGIDTTMINFGQPRVFDDAGANFVMARYSHYRVTHW